MSVFPKKRFVIGFCLLIGFCAGLTVPQAQELTTRRVAKGFDFPTFVISFPDEPNRLLVLEQYTGMIKVVDHGNVLETPFLDLEDRVTNSGVERGLLCLAFHPDFAENGYFYVSYTDKEGDNVLRRYSISTDPNIADAESGVSIMTIDQPNPEHNAGTIFFGPDDGYLYMSVGDGGFFTFNRAQQLSSPLGKILRIDVGDGSGDSYGIPPDNPYADSDFRDKRILAYGLRNPWRFSIDPATGDMYIGDVGEFSIEEVNMLPGGSNGGENFGWPDAEGFACRGGSGDCGTDEGFVPPVHNFEHAIGAPAAVIGGYVYRGEKIPSLQGAYFFADEPSARIWSLRMEEGKAVDVVDRSAELTPPGDVSLTRISSFGMDSDGEMYIAEYGRGEIYKIVTRAGLADINYNGETNAVDVQLVINAALNSGEGPFDADISINDEVDAVDVQTVINAVLTQ